MRAFRLRPVGRAATQCRDLCTLKAPLCWGWADGGATATAVTGKRSHFCLPVSVCPHNQKTATRGQRRSRKRQEKKLNAKAMCALVDKTAKRPLPRQRRCTPRMAAYSEAMAIAPDSASTENDAGDRVRLGESRYNLHDALKCINAHVRRALEHDRSNPDLDLAAAYVQEATHKSIDEWATQLGFTDWVQLFSNLSCVHSITWVNERCGWCVVPATKPPCKQPRPHTHGECHSCPKQADYDSPTLESQLCASRSWRSCWLRAITETVERVFREVHISRALTTPCLVNDLPIPARLDAPVVVDAATLAARVQESTWISPYRWVQYLGYADWNTLLLDLPCVRSLQCVPLPRDALQESKQRHGHQQGESIWTAFSRWQSHAYAEGSITTNGGGFAHGFGFTDDDDDDDALSVNESRRPWVRRRSAGPALPLKLIARMSPSLAAEQRVLSGSAVWVTTLKVCRVATSLLQTHAHIAVHCLMPDVEALPADGEGRVLPDRRMGIDILQIAAADGKGPCFFFDLHICDDEGRCMVLIDSGLKNLLEYPWITKVMRNARVAVERLRDIYLVAVKGVLDIDLLPGAAVEESDRAAHHDGAPAAAAATGAKGGTTLDSAMTRALEIDPHAWRRRPLPEWMVAHTMRNVHFLCAVHMRTMSQDLNRAVAANNTNKVCGEDAFEAASTLPLAQDRGVCSTLRKDAHANSLDPRPVCDDNDYGDDGDGDDGGLLPLDDIPLPLHTPTAPFPPFV